VRYGRDKYNSYTSCLRVSDQLKCTLSTVLPLLILKLVHLISKSSDCRWPFLDVWELFGWSTSHKLKKLTSYSSPCICCVYGPKFPTLSSFSIPFAINPSLTDSHSPASTCPQTCAINNEGLVTNTIIWRGCTSGKN